MRYEKILLRYGELALKGKNRNQFEKRLQENIRKQLEDFPKVEVTRNSGRMYVNLNGEPLDKVKEKLTQVFGIVSFSPTVKTGLEIEQVKEAALTLMRNIEPSPSTFKVSAKRIDKRFPYRSQEMNHLIGAHILRNTEHLTVDVHHPDVNLMVEVREEGVYLCGEVVPGIGGLPVGSSGKAMLMLSGGIDSPVAGWLMMKRGIKLEAVHFHSYPFTSERAKEKVIDLARILTRYGGPITMHIVPFTEIQTEIRKRCPENYLITIMRRFMMRITQRLAAKHHALAIATGESLGQVASQTVESMNTIGKVADIPILRPLVAMDKKEIMDLAREIGTYETSILPYEDCCTVFTPKSPVTKPKPEKAEEMERLLDVPALVEKAVSGTERITVKPKEENQMADLF